MLGFSYREIFLLIGVTAALIDNRKPEDVPLPSFTKDSTPLVTHSCNMHCQASTYTRLSGSPAVKNNLMASRSEVEKINDELQLTVIPVSIEITGLLPKMEADVNG